jgi:hypothetical protein
MTFKLFGYLITIEKLRRNQAIVPTGIPSGLTLKRPVYNPAKDPERLLDNKEFTYFKG